jgi:hypothetical protein
MSNYWGKQPSSRLLKAQNINWAGTGTSFSTSFLPQTNQIRVISQVAGYISIVPTTADGTIATTAQVGTFIPVNTAAAEYFTVTPGMLFSFASTTTSTLPVAAVNVTEMG